MTTLEMKQDENRVMNTKRVLTAAHALQSHRNQSGTQRVFSWDVRWSDVVVAIQSKPAGPSPNEPSTADTPAVSTSMRLLPDAETPPMGILIDLRGVIRRRSGEVQARQMQDGLQLLDGADHQWDLPENVIPFPGAFEARGLGQGDDHGWSKTDLNGGHTYADDRSLVSQPAVSLMGLVRNYRALAGAGAGGRGMSGQTRLRSRWEPADVKAQLSRPRSEESYGVTGLAKGFFMPWWPA